VRCRRSSCVPSHRRSGFGHLRTRPEPGRRGSGRGRLGWHRSQRPGDGQNGGHHLTQRGDLKVQRGDEPDLAGDDHRERGLDLGGLPQCRARNTDWISAAFSSMPRRLARRETSRFSPGAVEYANSIGSRVILIDGNRLTELMIAYCVGVQSGVATRSWSLTRITSNERRGTARPHPSSYGITMIGGRSSSPRGKA
jgi:hypothetical protein